MEISPLPPLSSPSDPGEKMWKKSQKKSQKIKKKHFYFILIFWLWMVWKWSTIVFWQLWTVRNMFNRVSHIIIEKSMLSFTDQNFFQISIILCAHEFWGLRAIHLSYKFFVMTMISDLLLCDTRLNMFGAAQCCHTLVKTVVEHSQTIHNQNKKNKIKKNMIFSFFWRCFLFF